MALYTFADLAGTPFIKEALAREVLRTNLQMFRCFHCMALPCTCPTQNCSLCSREFKPYRGRQCSLCYKCAQPSPYGDMRAPECSHGDES